MHKLIAALAMAAFSIVGGYAFVANGKVANASNPRSPVVIELFTSQGCSSCPPADALIGRLAREPGILAISRPVTYWDRLGWRDTLARPGNTALQRAYVERGVGGEVFTPQAVVQGQSSAIGSDERAIRRLIASAASEAGVSVTTIAANRGGVTLLLNGHSGPDAEIKLVTLLRNVPVRIGNGENGGRSIMYVRVWDWWSCAGFIQWRWPNPVRDSDGQHDRRSAVIFAGLG